MENGDDGDRASRRTGCSFEGKGGGGGLTLEEWLARLASVGTNGGIPAGESIVHLQRTDPKEWGRRFHAWVESHGPDTPVLSDEAMSRESIYPDIE